MAVSQDSTKRCCGCGEVKPISDFGLRRDRPCGRVARCKACTKIGQATSRAKNVAGQRASGAAYRAAHRAEQSVRAAAYHAANRAAICARKAADRLARGEEYRAKEAAHRAAHPAEYRAKALKHHAARPETYAAANAAWRARKRGATVGSRKSYRAFVAWARTAPSIPCYWCKAKTVPGRRHRDHVVPLAKGGADSVANLCISCPNCNSRKGPKMPEDFAGQSELRLA